MTGPLVVADPDYHAGHPILGDLIEELAARPSVVAVLARPGTRRPRQSDLVSDLLNALGRPGVSPIHRKHEQADVHLLMPYLMTAPVHELVVAEAQWLGVAGVEQLLAIATLCQLRAWLFLGDQPEHPLAELLHQHTPQALTFAEARDRLLATAEAVRDPEDSSVRQRLTAGTSSAAHEREALAARLHATDGPATWFTTCDRHTRQVTRMAAIAASQLVGEVAALRLTVEAVARDGSAIATPTRPVSVPAVLRAALTRQRLHALAVGQRPTDPFLTVDGSALSPAGLRALASHRAFPGPAA